MITVYVQRAYVLFCCWHICIFFTAQIKRPIIIQNMTFKRENFLAGDSFHSKFSSQAPNILIKKIFPNPKPAKSILNHPDWSFENISCAEWQIQHIYKWPSQVFALNEVVSLEAESPGKSLTPDVKEKYFEWCQKDISLAGILRQKHFDLLIFLLTDASTRVL